MPLHFTYDEYVNTLLIYDECQKIGVLETCTENVFPTEQLQAKILSLMWKTANSSRKPIQTEDNVINILAYLQVKSSHLNSMSSARTRSK